MFERFLLGAVAFCTLLYLLPVNLLFDLALMVIIAICLIAILALRARAWRHDDGSSFDIALIIGASVALVHLFTFAAFDRSALSFVTTILFAIFFGLLAVLMRPETAYARTDNAVSRPVSKPAHVDHMHDPEFRRGIDPIPERAPPHIPKLRHRVRAAVRHVFRPKLQPLPQLHPVHTAPTKHDDFKSGLEPIHEITPAHLHKLGVYDTVPRKR